MANIRALPLELLAHSLMFLVDIPAQQKMSMSHVCRQWRAAALSSSQFWATINAHDILDLKVLDTLLERSGAAALHVRIDRAAVDEHAINNGKNDDWTYVHANDLAEKQLGRLVDHASRLQTLVLGFEVGVPFERLLRSGLFFPVLDTLVIQRDQPWDDSVEINAFSVNWLAPALRTLTLTSVCPDTGWTDLLQNSPILENLSVTNCYGLGNEEVDELFASAFGLCHKLRKFTLVDDYIQDDDFTVPADGWKPSTSLCFLELNLGVLADEQLLEGLSATFIPSITITTYNGIEFPDDTVIPLFMHGIGRIVAIEVEPEQNVTLRDETGNERRLMIKKNRVVSPAYFTDLWQYVCTHHDATSAAATFAVTSENWESYSEMPSEVPPPTNVRLRLTRDLWVRREGRNRQPPLFGQGQDVLGASCSDIRCNARHVSYDTERANMGDVAPLKAALTRIKSPSTIELCLHVRSSHVDRERWIGEGLGIIGDLNASHDNDWILCAHCASASH